MSLPGAVLPAPEALLMMRPPLACAIIWRAAACEQRRTLLALTAISASQVASSVSRSGATAPSPGAGHDRDRTIEVVPWHRLVTPSLRVRPGAQGRPGRGHLRTAPLNARPHGP